MNFMSFLKDCVINFHTVLLVVLDHMIRFDLFLLVNRVINLEHGKYAVGRKTAIINTCKLPNGRFSGLLIYDALLSSCAESI